MTNASNASAAHSLPNESEGLSLASRPVQIAAVALVGALVWSYWPNIAEMVGVWNSNADYSHGYLVGPLALAFLWVRRDRIDLTATRPDLLGLGLIAGALAMRYFTDRFYLYELATWSMILWIAGACWLVGGRKFFWWTLPSVVFLLFAMKTPQRVELAMQVPLRQAATSCSCWVLQFLGLPAFADSNRIVMGEHVLDIAPACAGLRMSLGVIALAYAFVLLVPRPLWQKVVLALAALPIAIATNVLRIVITALMYQFASGEAARKFLHDISGIVTIPVAALLFLAAVWISDKFTVQVPVRRVKSLAANPV
ncbi:MAG: exosortase/archaeosortase family protein [Planctomycetales bacterium]|nr:exosortase/archaeosortase family protein [Planctomycetales bacterium]